MRNNLGKPPKQNRHHDNRGGNRQNQGQGQGQERRERNDRGHNPNREGNSPQQNNNRRPNNRYQQQNNQSGQNRRPQNFNRAQPSLNEQERMATPGHMQHSQYVESEQYKKAGQQPLLTNHVGQRDRSRAGGGHHTEDLLKKLDRYFELYLQARRKFHESYYKLDDNQKRRVENDMYEHLRNLRKHEHFLSKHHSYLLARKVVTFKQDGEYSSIHGDEKIEFPEGPVEDPHQTLLQKDRPSFKEDQEISSGTLEDYYTIRNQKK